MSIFMKTVFIFFITFTGAAAADNMKAFPEAEQGMVRYVLNLPERSNENDYKVEIVVGKNVMTDAQNRYFLAGQIKAEIIQGWGFTRYVVNNVGPMGGTLMAVNPDAAKVERFITLGGEPYLVRYNSRLPVVVYVPQGTQVRYRLWSAASAMPMDES